MKVLVLTHDPAMADLCKEAFSDAAADFTDREPLITPETPSGSELEAVKVTTDNIFAATQIYQEYSIYVSVEEAFLKDNASLSKAYILALRDRRNHGMPISIESVRITDKQDEKSRLLAGFRALIAQPRIAPTPDELKYLPAYE